MKCKIAIILSLLYLISISDFEAFSASKRSKPLRLRYADSLVGGQGVRTLYGNVWFTQGDMQLFSDFGREFENENSSYIEGNILMKRYDMNFYTNFARYNGNSRIIDATDFVCVTDTSSTILTANRGKYHINEEIADFYGNVLVENDSVVISAQTIRYERTTQNTFAKTKTVLLYKKNRTVITCDTAMYLPNKKYAFVGGFPILYNIDSTRNDSVNFELDTMSISSSKMEVFDENRFVCSEFVEIFRNDFEATCMKAEFYDKEKLITLSGTPTIWYEGNQIVSDTIAIFLENNRPKKIYSEGSAICMMINDTNYADRIDQISGDTLIIDFSEGKINMLTAIGAAKSLYFMADEEGLLGADRTSTENIDVIFEDNKPVKINWIGHSEKESVEPTKVFNNEKSYYLPFYKWNNNPPKKKELTFKCN